MISQYKKFQFSVQRPNENREVLVYNHFAGDNSYLKFLIKFKRKKNYLYIMQLFSADTTIFFLRPLDARNLRNLCMVFMIGQIMSGTQKLSQNNTPETFNRILEAIYDP